MIALVFAVEAGGGGFGFRGMNKSAKLGMNQGGACVDIKDGRGGASEGQRKSERPSETGAEGDLREIVVVELTVICRGVLLFSGGDSGSVGVLESEFHGAFQSDGLGQERRWQE